MTVLDPLELPGKDSYYEIRKQMVCSQIEARDISNENVLNAMRKVPRHFFVPESNLKNAYSDVALSLSEGQTISQPFIVAYMTEMLAVGHDSVVLEIGTGSGYQTAILSELVKEIYTVEVRKKLAEKARILLSSLGYKNIKYQIGNGADLWPVEKKFDGIIVTAACEKLPESLIQQLKTGAKLVVPLGSLHQRLHVITKEENGIKDQALINVRFVPFLWPEKAGK